MNPVNPLKRAPLLSLLTGILSVFIVIQAQAQEESERKTKQTVAMSQKVFEDLTEIQALVEAKQYAEGQAAIRRVAERGKLSGYERAQLNNLSGYAYYLSEEFPKAINAYEAVLREPELPEALQQATLKTLSQLHFIVEDYEKALETVKRLMAVVPEPAADVYMLLGQAHFQLKDYQQALGPIQTAIDMFTEQDRIPRENWLLLLRVCYYELNDFPNMILVLEQLIEHYPKDTYIITLAGVYSELGETTKQMSLIEALYEKGHLSNPSHIVNLANLYLLHEIPFKAADLLEREMASGRVGEDVRNLRLLSQAWYSAREDQKAVAPLQKAADLSDDGELYVRLAQAHLNLENWDAAAKAITKGLELGGINREDTSNIMLGMAYFNQKKFPQARRAFERAVTDNRSRRTAQQWIKYVDSEIKRLAVMDQELPINEAREVGDLESMLNSSGPN